MEKVVRTDNGEGQKQLKMCCVHLAATVDTHVETRERLMCCVHLAATVDTHVETGERSFKYELYAALLLYML